MPEELYFYDTELITLKIKTEIIRISVFVKRDIYILFRKMTNKLLSSFLQCQPENLFQGSL